MSLILGILWPGLAAALVLGLAVGAFAGLPRRRSTLAGASALALGIAVLGSVALFGTIPGRPGSWAEVAALVLAAYLAGCGLGGVGRRLAGRSA